ncbi:MAG: DUF58 domain-containing protein [Pseudomonadota bacterium]
MRRSKPAAGTLFGALPFASRLTPHASRLPIRDRIGDWIFPPKGPEAGPVVLGQRRVYILPTSAGLMFAVTLVLLLVGSINYNLSLGYILTFLLAGIGVVSILHTWRNLARVALRPAKTRPVFAGDSARFHIVVENPGAHQRLSLAIELAGQSAVYFDVAPRDAQDVEAAMPTARRGVLQPGRFRIFTVYPVGLFYAWANVELDLHCLVYARPEPGHVPLPPAQAASGQGGASGAGEEDFAGLRTYHPGDSPRRIAWKAFARSDVILTKQFSGSAASELWLNLADIPETLGLEARLSRLTRWVIEAETAGQRFGLRLPGIEFEREFGASHRDRCLQAIALYKPARG